MSRNYLFLGASSQIAKEACITLRENGNRVVGITTKQNIVDSEFEDLYSVISYKLENLPDINISSLDGLVYFPGSINLKPFLRISEEEFLEEFTLNALGAASSIQKYLPLLKNGKNSSIVLISSVAVSIGLPFHTSISMAKGAVEGLTKSLASELAPTIRVNCVAPSLTNTPLAEKLVNTPEKYESCRKINPMNKIGHAKDISSAIVFLLTESSSWITGQILAVDGGMSSIKNR